jgi:microcystin-dependent protein
MPFIGEIRIFAGNFAPAGWAFCDGQLLPISENDALFTLLGTTFGGDGQETFALPDLRGRLPLHQGNSFIIGQNGGVEEVTLTTNHLPTHSHPYLASGGPGSSSTPVGHVHGEVPSLNVYIDDNPNANFSPASITFAGGSQPHNNLQPYQCVNFIISLFGIFPSRN